MNRLECAVSSFLGAVAVLIATPVDADPLFEADPGVSFVGTYCIEKTTTSSERKTRTTYREGPCTLGRTSRGFQIFGHDWGKREYPLDEIGRSIEVKRTLSQLIVFKQGNSSLYVYASKPDERP